MIIYTPAIPADNKELLYFRENGFVIQKRAQVLGTLTTAHKGLCFAGTHGKTTTSTMCAHLMHQSHLDEMREALGIEPGRDGYMRWLLQLGGYENILKLDTGIGDREHWEDDLKKVSERTRLTIKEAEAGWATLQPTDDLYSKCKSMLGAQ